MLYNKADWGWGLNYQQVCYANAAAIGVSLFSFVKLEESSTPKADPIDLKASFETLWEIVSCNAAWSPLLWVFMYNCAQVQLCHPARVSLACLVVSCLCLVQNFVSLPVRPSRVTACSCPVQC